MVHVAQSSPIRRQASGLYPIESARRVKPTRLRAQRRIHPARSAISGNQLQATLFRSSQSHLAKQLRSLMVQARAQRRQRCRLFPKTDGLTIITCPRPSHRTALAILQEDQWMAAPAAATFNSPRRFSACRVEELASLWAPLTTRVFGTRRAIRLPTT